MCTGPRYRLIIYIRHLYISCNTPCSPPKTLHNICFSFPLGITAVPREVENNRARETKFHICARRQTWICTTWPRLSFTFYYFYAKISRFAPVLSIRIVLDSFYLLIFCCEKYSTWTTRLQFAVNVTCNLSKAYPKGWVANKVHFGKCGSGEHGFITCPIIQTVGGANKLN